MQVYLVGYQGQVEKKTNSNKNKAETLSSLSSGHDFLDISDKYFQSISDLVTEASEQKAFQGKNHVRENRLMWGLIESGNYGYGATLKNVRTRKVQYERDTNDVELLPYFYMLYVPSGYDRSILILQKFGNLGIKSILSNALIHQFNTDHEVFDLKLDFKPYLDPHVLYHYITHGAVKKLRFVRRSLPNDIADRVRKSISKGEASGEVEFTISKTNSSTLRAVLGDALDDLKAGRRPAGGITFDVGFDYDFVKLDVEDMVTHRIKTFSMINTDGFIESREINLRDPNVESERGLPTYKSIHKKAIDYLEELCDNLDIRKPTPRPVWRQ